MQAELIDPTQPSADNQAIVPNGDAGNFSGDSDERTA